MELTRLEKEWRDKFETICEANDVCQIELNEWEVDFLESIEIMLSQGKILSFKQSSILRRIYDRIG